MSMTVRHCNDENKVRAEPAISQIGDSRCTGCSACVNACERGALVMSLIPEGFYRPQIDPARCTACGVCAQKCPVLAAEKGYLRLSPWLQPKAFAAWSCDEKVRLNSTSGGVFTEIARLFIRRGGVVVGCSWSSDWTPKHVLAQTEEEIAAFRGSKYVQSSLSEALSETTRLCRNGVPVLFSGTPCQIAAVKQMLRTCDQRYLVTCEIVCHGVTSVRMFHSYLDWLFSGKSVEEFFFRYKPLGWEISHVHARSIGGDIYEAKWGSDPWAQLAMGYHLSLMGSCFSCVFQKKQRVADITLGDFWGCPEDIYDSRGVSVVLINSAVGEGLFASAVETSAVEAIPIEWKVAVAQNARAIGKSFPIHRYYRAFLRDVALGHSFQYLRLRYYIPLTIATKMVTLTMTILSKLMPSTLKSVIKRCYLK